MQRLLLCLLTLSGVGLFAGADWLQFRGDRGQSVSDEAGLPIKWGGTDNVAWQSELPGRGASSPIVVGDRVFVTCSSGFKQDRLHVICFDADTGQRLWQRRFWATGRTLCHPSSTIAAPTPASDGRRVFAFYSSNDLICLDTDGNLQWLRGLTHEFPTAANDVGMAASPVVVDETVIVQVENEGESFAAGIDTTSGQTRWRQRRSSRMNWSSPAVWRQPGGDNVVLLQSPDRLTAVDPKSGEQVWEFAAGCASIASPVGNGRVVYVASDGLTALVPHPGSANPEILWRAGRLSPGTSSPVVHDGRVYALNSSGGLTCGDADTGEVIWRLRLEGSFWATPVLAGGHLYCVNQDGLAQVVKLGDRGEVVARNEFGESIISSPAVATGAIYFRSDGHLWKIARP